MQCWGERIHCVLHYLWHFARGRPFPWCIQHDAYSRLSTCLQSSRAHTPTHNLSLSLSLSSLSQSRVGLSVAVDDMTRMTHKDTGAGVQRLSAVARRRQIRGTWQHTSRGSTCDLLIPPGNKQPKGQQKLSGPASGWRRRHGAPPKQARSALLTAPLVLLGHGAWSDRWGRRWTICRANMVPHAHTPTHPPTLTFPPRLAFHRPP